MAEGWQPDAEADDDGPHPALLATLFAGVYALLCGAYIVLSGRWAARAAGDVSALAAIEQWKGLGFVAATALLFFGLAWWMLHRLAARQRLIQRQRRALVAGERRALAGVFAASVAHDINNVLTVASAHVERLAPEAPAERRPRSYDAVRSALADLGALAQRLVALARGHAGDEAKREPLDLARLVRDTVEFARRHARVRGCQVSVSAPSSVEMRGNAVALRRLLLNLLLNAADATGGKGRIDVRLAAEGEGVLLEVHDDGPGVPPELRERLFEGLQTTKPDGSGLGLLSVRVTACEHGGRVGVSDSELGGACFAVWIPRAGEAG